MTAQSLPVRLWHEARLYGSAARGFRRNAQLYLFSIPLMGLGLSLFGLLYNLYLLELGFTEVFIGQVAAATGLGLVFGSIPGGMLYSRGGGRIGLTAGMITVALAQLSQLSVRTPVLLLATTFFFVGFALFQANVTLFDNVVMEVVQPRERGRQASIRIFIMYLGYSLAGLLGGRIIVHLGYGSLFAVAAVAFAIAGVASWLFFRRSPAARPIR